MSSVLSAAALSGMVDISRLANMSVASALFMTHRHRLSHIKGCKNPHLQNGERYSSTSAEIRSSWLYFATRSDRAGAPVLI